MIYVRLQASWVTCQFSPDLLYEHLLLVGDQDGHFYVVDVRYASECSNEKLIKQCNFFYC